MLSRRCLALLALSALAAASDPGCDELIKPMEDRSKISGKWISYVGAADTEENLKYLKSFNSSWIDISTIPSDNMTLRFTDRHEGKCLFGTANFTYEGIDTKVTYQFNSTSHDGAGRHLETCPDCLLWLDRTNSKEKGENKYGKYLHLYTRTGDLADSDLAIFKKQAACLNFVTDIHLAETKYLCPDEKEAS